MMNDPIADLLTRIRNANQRHLRIVKIPSSKQKCKIVKILKEEGYIIDFKINIIDKEKIKKEIEITLKYKTTKRVISGLTRISTPGLRVYSKAEQVPKVLNGLGTAILSTSKGIMTGKQAKQQKLGGEVIAFIW